MLYKNAVTIHAVFAKDGRSKVRKSIGNKERVKEAPSLISV